MSEKRVVVAMGSPRKKGNSALLVSKLIEGVEAAGGECEELFLQGMKIEACTACDKCLDAVDRYCVIEDDMKPLYPDILEAGALVFASPVYWFTVSAQTKLFMDRLYAFLGPDGSCSLKGKKMGIMLTFGDTDPFTSGAVNALRTFQDAFAYIGAPIIGAVYGSAEDPGEIGKNEEVLQKAYDLGKKLVI
jgi:multimeric flavodoxin WrbA